MEREEPEEWLEGESRELKPLDFESVKRDPLVLYLTYPKITPNLGQNSP